MNRAIVNALLILLLAGAGALCGGEDLLQNGDFSGKWVPLKSNWETGTAEGASPDSWEDVSTWSGASTRYTRVPGPPGAHCALRLEMLKATTAQSVLQLRSGFDIQMLAGQAYRIRLSLRSPTETPVEIAIRQHKEPRLQFWQMKMALGPEWRTHEFIAEPLQTGPARFFVALREPGILEVANMSVQQLGEGEKPEPKPPLLVRQTRCVRTRGDLIKHSDVIAMYQEADMGVLRKYGVDIVAWGGQLQADEKTIQARKNLIAQAHDAGVRMHAVDCALVQEGGRFVVAGGDRESATAPLFWELRKDNEDAIKRIGEAGIDLSSQSVLDIDGQWVGVPWLAKRWRIPMASVYSPSARKWYREQMEAIAQTGLTTLHFDEPGMGAYGVTAKQPGDFSDHAMGAFRQWLADRPEDVWRQAGIESLEGFDFREFVRDHGGVPQRAPLWREFVRFQLFTTADFVRELRDVVRAKAGQDIPLSMNANASTWVKLPFLKLQDFMTTEVAHEARSRQVPSAPLLVYKLGDAFSQPVASTAHGHDWYEMKKDQHPVLVSSWMAMAYALGHHLMVPCKAWVMDPVTGSDIYRPVSDHYACLARFIKDVSGLLDGYAPVSVVSVVVGCDALEKDGARLEEAVKSLADANIPFSMAVEGNDLLEREVVAADLDGSTAILVASPSFLSESAAERLHALAGDRPVVDHYGGPVPTLLPRPIAIEGVEGVWALPRMDPGAPQKPVAIHLLNRDYDPQARQMVSKGPFTLRIDRALFGNRSFKAAAMYAPSLSVELPGDGNCTLHTALELEQTAEGIEIQVQQLDLWGIIELR